MSKRSNKPKEVNDEQDGRMASSDVSSFKKVSGEECKRKVEESSNEEASDNELVQTKPCSKVAKTEKFFADNEDTSRAFRNVKYAKCDDAKVSASEFDDGATDSQINFMEILARRLKKKLGADVEIDTSSKANASDWIEFANETLGKKKK